MRVPLCAVSKRQKRGPICGSGELALLVVAADQTMLLGCCDAARLKGHQVFPSFRLDSTGRTRLQPRIAVPPQTAAQGRLISRLRGRPAITRAERNEQQVDRRL